DARYDGLYVLRTNTKLDPLNAMLRYRELLVVERLFRTTKDLLTTRPIYHQTDAAIRGHVFCSFLALVLRKELERGSIEAGTDSRARRSRSLAGGRGRTGRQAFHPAHTRHRRGGQSLPGSRGGVAAEHPGSGSGAPGRLTSLPDRTNRGAKTLPRARKPLND